MTVGILAVDPGLMSGICFMTWSESPEEDPILVGSYEANEDEYPDVISDFLSKWEDYSNFYVICEKFTINAQTVKKTQAPYSLEQIGVLKYLCKNYGFDHTEINFQMPADAKNMFSNPTLKTLGFWHVGGAGHALDAIRHALLGLARKKWIPRALLKQQESY